MPVPHGLPDPLRDAQFYAGAGARRLIAFCLDAAAVAALTFAATLVATLMTFGAALALVAPIWLTVGFLYRWLSLSRWSATPGMRLTGVEARDLRGEPLGGAQAAAHTAGFVAACLFVLPQIVSVALMATRPDGRALHDLAAGVALINRPA